MAKRDPCNIAENPSWTGLFLGDCGQHLRTGECPAVSGIKTETIVGGGAYISKPVALISGDSGGNVTGFYGYGLLNPAGYVTGLEVFSSGWHVTKTPVLIFSGTFKSGVGGGVSDCSGKLWDTFGCACSGTGLVAGYKIWQNVTRLPPQCSWEYDSGDWPLRLASLGECSEAELAYAHLDGMGHCRTTAAHPARCVTSIDSGWNGECGSHYAKAENFCLNRGRQPPRGRCLGNWYDGSMSSHCGPEIRQEWLETDEYLDWGVCTKRGYKNAVAMKSWHGEAPFTIKTRCLPRASDSEGYDKKYLSANGSWTLNSEDNRGGCSRSCPIHGTEGASNYTSANVGRYDGKIDITSSFNYENNQWYGQSPYCRGIGGFDRCLQGFRGFTGQPYDDLEDSTTWWNWRAGFLAEGGEVGVGNWVSTTLNVTPSGYVFVQEIGSYSWHYSCCEYNEFYECVRSGLQHDFEFYSIETVAVDLSNPYTYQELNHDTDELLNQWNFLDDVIYPWKTTESINLMPKITHCEAAPTSPIEGMSCLMENHCESGLPLCSYSEKSNGITIEWDDCTPRPEFPSVGTEVGCDANHSHINCSFSDARCSTNCWADGRVLGGPAKTGHFRTVDFTYIHDQDDCCSCSCDTINNYITKGFGLQSSLHHLTQWPGVKESRLMYFGAFGAINDTYADAGYSCSLTLGDTAVYPFIPYDVLVKAKYAEIIQMDKPSRNFRMPCGVGSSGDWTLVNSSDATIIKQSTLYYTGDCNCIASGRSGVIDAGGGRFCNACTGQTSEKERWPAFGLSSSGCGTIITVASGSCTTSGATLTLNGEWTGEVGDYINGYFTLGNPALLSTGTYRIEERLSLSGIRISGTFFSPNSYVSGWVDFAQDNMWWDSRPKGDFVIREWQYPTFGGTPAARQNVDPWLASLSTSGACVPWQGCDPSIVMILPTGSIEKATSGTYNRNLVIREMPTLVPDPYGSRFHILPQQWMTDPMWTPPSRPCCLADGLNPDRYECQPLDGNGFGATNIYHYWEEDDGSCKYIVDEYRYGWASASILRHHYWPMRPFVEARISGLGPYILPNTLCAFPNTTEANLTGACWSITTMEAMPTGLFQAISFRYGAKLCPICEAPFRNTDYWGIYAPWLVSPNQLACINEKWPIEDTNPAHGFEGEGV